MNRVTPFFEISSFEQVAVDLGLSLNRADNEDIAKGFPSTVVRYGGAVLEAVANMETARSLYEVGKREQFIVFSGEKAVGLCIITNQIDVPEGISPNAPNISGFITNPYRGQGLGRLSIEERMKVVKKNFNDRAWTFVKDGNLPSEHLVTSVGFQQSDLEIEGWEGHHLYLFGDAEL